MSTSNRFSGRKCSIISLIYGLIIVNILLLNFLGQIIVLLLLWLLIFLVNFLWILPRLKCLCTNICLHYEILSDWLESITVVRYIESCVDSFVFRWRSARTMYAASFIFGQLVDVVKDACALIAAYWCVSDIHLESYLFKNLVEFSMRTLFLNALDYLFLI